MIKWLYKWETEIDPICFTSASLWKTCQNKTQCEFAK